MVDLNRLVVRSRSKGDDCGRWLEWEWSLCDVGMTLWAMDGQQCC